MAEGFTFPVLSAIVLIPIVAGVIILFMDGKQRDLIRGVAISAAVVVLTLAAMVYFSYNSQVGSIVASQESLDPSAPGYATQMFDNGLRFQAG